MKVSHHRHPLSLALACVSLAGLFSLLVILDSKGTSSSSSHHSGLVRKEPAEYQHKQASDGHALDDRRRLFFGNTETCDDAFVCDESDPTKVPVCFTTCLSQWTDCVSPDSLERTFNSNTCGCCPGATEDYCDNSKGESGIVNYTCPDEPLVNISSILQTAFGVNGTDGISEQERALVNELCIEVYNEMTFEECDPYFRIATFCDLFVNLTDDFFEGLIEGACWGCQNSDSVFGDFGWRRQLEAADMALVDWSLSSSDHATHRRLDSVQQVGECLCSPNGTNDNVGEESASAFIPKFLRSQQVPTLGGFNERLLQRMALLSSVGTIRSDVVSLFLGTSLFTDADGSSG